MRSINCVLKGKHKINAIGGQKRFDYSAIYKGKREDDI
jgi:hypothetical protein